MNTVPHPNPLPGGEGKQIPRPLFNQGISAVRDNLEDGDVLYVGRSFMLLYRTELEDLLITKAEQKGGSKK